jgi:hypothetical protein
MSSLNLREYEMFSFYVGEARLMIIIFVVEVGYAGAYFHHVVLVDSEHPAQKIRTYEKQSQHRQVHQI